jgi:hypothetical protein
MRVRTISAYLVGCLAIASCTVGVEDSIDASLVDDDEDEDLGSFSEPLTKGSPGAVNGAKDYCDDPANQCASGQGDCDSNAQCASGTRCLPDNGQKFGFPANFDVCGPIHCNNKVQDAGLGETGVDVGGPCGTSPAACSGTAGEKTFCTGCQCASGQGDCDTNAECATGLVCGANNGPKFGLPTGYDVCVPSHCSNGVQDAGSGETGIDTGGVCGTGMATPTRNVFFSEYAEGSGNDHHLEIFNAGNEAQSCTVRIYYSGAVTPTTTLALNASIAAGGLFVLCRSGGTVGSPPCNQLSSTIVFNGDDAVELVCGGVTQDIIGQIGLDPGSQWGSGLASTADNTLRRKCSVTTGDKDGSNAFLPVTEWDGFANNTFANLGQRTCP